MMEQLSNGWEVEWCNHIERDGDGIIPESARYCYKEFSTKGQAVAHAQKMAMHSETREASVRQFWSDEYGIGYSEPEIVSAWQPWPTL